MSLGKRFFPSIYPYLRLSAPHSLSWLHFQAGSPYMAAGWSPTDQVLPFGILRLVTQKRETERPSLRVTPAEIPGLNLIGPAWSWARP